MLTEVSIEQIGRKKKKIGEILLEKGFITKEILSKALEHQERSGGSLAQYLLGYGYIDENKLATCLSTQFGVPYLPLTSYEISEEVIKLVPVDIAQKYWLIPVDRMGDSITIVMADPFNAQAIKEVEDITGLKVNKFVGMLSEIVTALEVYYKILLKQGGIGGVKTPPFFIDTETYRGLERRHSIRFKSKINIQFPTQGYYKQSQTKDVSRDGLLFQSDIPVPVGSILTLEVSLPKEVSPLPIAIIAQVVRTAPVGKNKFDISVKTLKASKEELTAIVGYASTHQEK